MLCQIVYALEEEKIQTVRSIGKSIANDGKKLNRVKTQVRVRQKEKATKNEDEDKGKEAAKACIVASAGVSKSKWPVGAAALDSWSNVYLLHVEPSQETEN